MGRNLQKIDAIEKWYSTTDPWNYQNNAEDLKRKTIILDSLNKYGSFKKALDIGAGEGWISKDLPAQEIFAFEISKKASSRFPKNVIPVNELKGKFDLIIATGIMYADYDIEFFIKKIKECASRIVLVSSIKESEVEEIKQLGDPIYKMEFPYREFIQTLKIYDYSA